MLPQILLSIVLCHQQLLAMLMKVAQCSCQALPLHISAWYNNLCSSHPSIFTDPTLQLPCTQHRITKELTMRQVSHSKLPYCINLIVSHRCPSLSLSLGARTSTPNLLNRHKICASGMKNGDSLLLQIQALHNPNLETSTTTVEECIWMPSLPILHLELCTTSS